MRKVGPIRERTFYCQACGKHSIILITPNVKEKSIKCGHCKADSDKLLRVKK